MSCVVQFFYWQGEGGSAELRSGSNHTSHRLVYAVLQVPGYEIGDSLSLAVFDKDEFTADDLLGRLSLKSLMAAGICCLFDFDLQDFGSWMRRTCGCGRSTFLKVAS